MTTSQSMVDHMPFASVVSTEGEWYVAFAVYVGDIVVSRSMSLTRDQDHARQVATAYNHPLGPPVPY